MSIKIYTKTGDGGETSLLGGARVSKSGIQLEAYGSIDELNSWIGLAAAQGQSGAASALKLEFKKIQNELFNVGSLLACAEVKLKEKLPPVSAELPTLLEAKIDQMTSQLPELKDFILPGGDIQAAQLHVARTVCRRAERETIRYFETQKILSSEEKRSIIILLNRLSDFLFVASRYINYLQKIEETKWQK
jgi:cob(I)alamin adenosyltransferase